MTTFNNFNSTKGYLIDIQHFSVNDGDGIRSTIFFAGCPLRCAWCSNPESFTTMNKVLHNNTTCISCGRCVKVCPHDVGIDLNEKHMRNKCTGCGICVPICPTESRKSMIMEQSPHEVVNEVSKYFKFFKKSGGGVTYSGGECTSQHEFLKQLVESFYDYGINQAIETSAYFDFEKSKNILSKMDLIFTDIKHFDDSKHKYFTGRSNLNILENIKKLAKIHTNIVIRIPLIKGVNSSYSNIKNTAEFVARHLKYPKIELLPYHRFGEAKYESLNISKPSSFFQRPTPEEITDLQEIIKKMGVETVSYK